jgi:hypothetical protein
LRQTGCEERDYQTGNQPFCHEQMLPLGSEMATTPAILRRAYSIARSKSTEIQSIYRIDQEMLWRLVSEPSMMSAIYAVAG